MRNTLLILAGSSLVSLALVSACNDNKGFKGGTATANAKPPAASNVDPEEPATPPVLEPAPSPVEVVQAPEPETTNVFKDCDISGSANFVADLYQLPVDTKVLPDFSALTSIKQICLKQL